jgi:hypothetical protein
LAFGGAVVLRGWDSLRRGAGTPLRAGADFAAARLAGEALVLGLAPFFLFSRLDMRDDDYLRDHAKLANV